MSRPVAIRSLVLLLSRPPYVRWALAGCVLVAALGWELSERATEPYPFAARAIERGEHIAEEAVEWRELPRGSLPRLDLAGSSARVDIEDGEPLTRSVVGHHAPIPDGWWSVPLALPVGVPVGAEVRLSLIDGSTVDGIVAIAATDDDFGIERPGAVAVPPGDVDRVATSAAAGTVLVLVAP